MTTYLQLVKDTARESGTVPGYSSITSVVGQTGRVALFANWVRQAYRDIQTMRDDWRWLNGEFEGTLINGVSSYAATDLGIDVGRFSHWINPHDDLEHFTCYPTASGIAEEEYLIERSYEQFKRSFRVGEESLVTGRPQYFAIDPQDRIVVHPIPDADHVIKGKYYKAQQDLSTNDEQPEMPRRYHDIIMWGALVHMCTFDEAFEQIQIFQGRYDMIKRAMNNENTPTITLAGPLA